MKYDWRNDKYSDDSNMTYFMGVTITLMLSVYYISLLYHVGVEVHYVNTVDNTIIFITNTINNIIQLFINTADNIINYWLPLALTTVFSVK